MRIKSALSSKFDATNAHAAMPNSPLKITLIGHGHFGQALENRLKKRTPHFDLKISKGRGQNSELIPDADLIVICVRPLQLNELFSEIRSPLEEARQKNAPKTIISFAAAAPQNALQKVLNHPIIRAMADLQFDQVLSLENPQAPTQKHAAELFKSLSENPPIMVNDEEKMEAYTVLVACLSGVQAWHRSHQAQTASTWLKAYTEFIQTKLEIPKAVLQNILTKGHLDPDPLETIRRMATPGGVTEALLQVLDQNSNCSFEELYLAGLHRIHSMQKAIVQSLMN